jgi:CubicO group peptidase (beta-lactamase class C family)
LISSYPALAQLNPPDSILRPYLERPDTRGLAVGLYMQGFTAGHYFGMARPASHDPVMPKTVFEIGSITKIFTNLLLAQAAQDSLTRLDTALVTYAPKDLAFSSQDSGITLRHLATHTSGLPRIPRGHGVPMKLTGHPYEKVTARQLWAYLAGLDQATAPGKQWEYSNTGGALLGAALAELYGIPYDSLCRRQLFQPLGMRNTRVHYDSLTQAYAATGSSRFGFNAKPWRFKGMAPAGAIKSTLPDMLQFLRSCLGDADSSLAAAQALAQEIHFRDAAPATPHMGLGWLIGPHTTRGEPVIWHNGGTGGFRSFIGFLPDQAVGVVLLANASRPVSEMGHRLLDVLAMRARQRGD